MMSHGAAEFGLLTWSVVGCPVEVLTGHCLPAVHHCRALLIAPAEMLCGLPSIGEEYRVTLQEIQERYLEITDDWAAEDPQQQWGSMAELDDLLRELEDVDHPDTPAVQELRERIEALMDEIECHLDVQLVAVADEPAGGD